MHPLGHMTVAGGTIWIGARLFGSTSAAARELVDRIDYRLVVVGALLPDLIDKPIGWLIFRDHFDANGHLWGHTLLAVLVVLVPGIWFLARNSDPRLTAMALAMLTHLAVDPVNHSPQNLRWPLLGTDFPEITLLGTKMTILTESISALILASVAIVLVRTYRFPTFILEGRIDLWLDADKRSA